MHPPLFKPHPLCKKEVEDLVACHENNPFMKFLNACGETKMKMDACFKEEKKLRKKLNPQISATYPLRMIPKGEDAAAAAAAPAPPAGGAGAPPATA